MLERARCIMEERRIVYPAERDFCFFAVWQWMENRQQET